MFTRGSSRQINLPYQPVSAKAPFIKSVFFSLSRLFLFFSMACLGMAASPEARAGERSIQEELSETEGNERRRGSISSESAFSVSSYHSQASNFSFDEISDSESEGGQRWERWSAISSESSSPSLSSSSSSSASSPRAQAENSDLYGIQQEMRRIGDELLNADLDDVGPLVNRLQEVQKNEQQFKQLIREEEQIRAEVLTAGLGDMAPLAERLHEMEAQRQSLLSSHARSDTTVSNAELSIAAWRDRVGSSSQDLSGSSVSVLPHSSNGTSLASSSDAEPMMSSQGSDSWSDSESERDWQEVASINAGSTQQAVPADGMEFVFPTMPIETSTSASSNHTDTARERAAEGGVELSHASVNQHDNGQMQTVEKTPLNRREANTEAPAVQANNAHKQLTQVNAATPATTGYESTHDSLKVGADSPVRVSNIAPGAISAASTDAVNGAQLFGSLAASKHYTDRRFSEVQQNINQVARHAYGGIAAAMAMPNQTPRENGNTVVAVGAANFKGQNAVGFGITHRSRGGQFLFHGAASTAGAAGVGVRVQAGYEF